MDRDGLVYTSILNSALGLGIGMADVRKMPFGRVVMMLQARAQSYKKSNEPRQASWDELKSWAGCGSL